MFDRLGNGGETIEIAGIELPKVRIPVTTGRNISVVIEAFRHELSGQADGL